MATVTDTATNKTTDKATNKDKESSAQSIINLRRIVLVLSIGLIVLAFFSLSSIRKQKTYEKQSVEFVERMQEQVASMTEANARMTFELEQLNKATRIGDTITSKDVWHRKIDSLERLNYYNSVMNQIVALNESTLTKAREDNQRLYDDYLTHINSIIAFFGIIIAVISIFVPYLINRKTDDIIKKHEESLDELTRKINEKAEEARRSAIQSEIITLNNIGSVNEAKGDYTKSLENYEKALTICRSNLGEKHLDTASIYNNMARVYVCLGDFNTAQVYLNKALSIRESELGTDHLDTAAIYNSLAEIFESKYEYRQALDYYNKALIIRESKLGTEHLDTAANYSNIAWVYEHMGDYNNALKYFVKALKVWLNRKVQHQNAKTCFKNLKVCFIKSSISEGMDEWMKEQLNEQEWEAYLKLKKNLE